MEPTWKIDSIAVALLVVAAIPWLGEIFESIDLPGGTGIKYRLEKVEGRAEDVAGQVAKLGDLLPLVLPDDLFVHLKNLSNHRTRPYYGNEPLQLNLRRLRGMRLIESLPGKYLSRLPEGEFDLADWVDLSETGREWIATAAKLDRERASLPD